MKHRTWLLEALRLHFEEKLSRIEAGRRLGTGTGFRVRGAPLSAGAGIELADTGNETSLTLGWNGVYGENGRQENAGNLSLNVAF